MKRPQSRPNQSGFTMLEVLVGLVLISILLIGMGSLWVAVGRQLDDVMLRQKAIFRINGEMERLARLYVTGTGPSNPVTVTDYAANAPVQRGSYIADIANTPDGARLIYKDNGAPVTNDVTTFSGVMDANMDDAPSNYSPNAIYTRIYYYGNNTSGTTDDDRNFVWLDREHNVVAQISWELMAIKGNDAANRNCYTLGATGICQLLTLYLDYPFRFSTANPRGDMGPVETITLQTIVGERP